MLREFIDLNREEILARTRTSVSARTAPVATTYELTEGLPAFLGQLSEALRKGSACEVVDHSNIQVSAGRHGDRLFDEGLSVAQVVHDYGGLCQVITALAFSQRASIPTDEFQILNLCLDDAIAGAVTAHARQRERAISEEGTERLGVLAHEMRNLLNAAMMSFSSIKSGLVAPGGSTSAIHERSLMGLNALIDRSLADVRLDAGIQSRERLSVSEIVDEAAIVAGIVAHTRGLHLVVVPVDASVTVEADRQILTAAVANLLQNALKFTRPHSTVMVRAVTTSDRVLIEVEDECGGLQPGTVDTLLQPFVQKGADRSGLGLGLAICVKAARASAGEVRIRDLPGKGCIFTMDLPQSLPSRRLE